MLRSSTDSLNPALAGWEGYYNATHLDASFLANGFEDGCNFHTLPPSLRHAVYQVSFFGDIAEIECQSLTLPLSKAMNSRCQGRKSGTVTQKCIINTPERLTRYANIHAKWRSQEEAKPPRRKREKRDLALVHEVNQTRERFDAFSRLVLCSLLGNYRHCRVRMQQTKARQALYQIVTTSTVVVAETWLQSLLHQAVDVIQWCVRDFIVAVIEDSPALHASVAEHIHFDAFRELTQQAMGQVRAYLDQQLSVEWSHATRCFTAVAETKRFAYCQCLSNTKKKTYQSPCAYAHHVWLQDLVVPLRLLFHERFLSIQYYKPHTDVVNWLVSQKTRVAFPLWLRPDAPPPPPLVEEKESESDSDDDDDEKMDLALNGNALQHLQRAFAREEKRKQQREKRKKRKLVGTMWSTVDARMYVTHEEFQQLRDVVDTNHTLEGVVRCLALPSDIQAEWLHLLQSHRDASGSNADRVGALRRLHALDHHSYNLVQVAAELIKERHPLDGVQGRCLGSFSAQLQAQQIRAARSKLVNILCTLQMARMAQKDIPVEDKALVLEQAQKVMVEIEHTVPPTAVDERSTSLVFCRICGVVYSHVRATHLELEEASVTTRKYYRFGLDHARRNYLTGETYCKKRMVTHRGACQETPLVSVSLLGRRYAFQGRQYQLCCSCGDIMSPDPAYGAGGGTLCTECTDKLQERTKADQEKRIKALVAKLEHKCTCCGHPSTGPTCTFLYPFQLVMCAKCHHAKRVEEVVARQWSSQTELRAFLGELHTNYRSNKHTRQVRRGVRAMKRNKQKDRAKKA